MIIVDYGLGNLGSIANMLKRIGVESSVSADPAVISKARRLILPGVGSFDEGMKNIEERGLRAALDRKALDDRIPVLGICLGMQLLTRGSEEGERAGLGWIGAKTVRFRFSGDAGRLKIPHMGWNRVYPRHGGSLFREMDDEAAFYFVHSYHVVCDDEQTVLGTTRHGYEFTSAVQAGNILGAQFHPEKSHRYGMQLLRNFAEFEPC